MILEIKTIRIFQDFIFKRGLKDKLPVSHLQVKSAGYGEGKVLHPVVPQGPKFYLHMVDSSEYC